MGICLSRGNKKKKKKKQDQSTILGGSDSFTPNEVEVFHILWVIVSWNESVPGCGDPSRCLDGSSWSIMQMRKLYKSSRQ